MIEQAWLNLEMSIPTKYRLCFDLHCCLHRWLVHVLTQIKTSSVNQLITNTGKPLRSESAQNGDAAIQCIRFTVLDLILQKVATPVVESIFRERRNKITPFEMVLLYVNKVTAFKRAIITILFPVVYLRGKMIYQGFVKKLLGRGYLFVFNNAIGEVVFSCGYIPELLKQNHASYSIAIVNAKLKSALNCYTIFDDVVVLSNRDLKCLCTYLNDKNPEKMRAYNSIWSSKKQCQRADNPLIYENGENRLAKVYADYFNVSWNSKITRPTVKNINELTFPVDCFVKGKTIVLNPQANTCKMFSCKFWQNLAIQLEDKGYFIVFNCDSGYDAGKFQKILPELDEISAVVNFCGSCISIQCGLSDLLVESGCCVHVVFNENTGDTNYERHSSSGGPYTIPNMYINHGDEEEKIIKDILLHYDYL